jgi:T5SS/PEP-CTERM-associated repeat protein
MRFITGAAPRSILAMSLLSLAATPLWGQTFTWQPTSGGLFNAAANWSPVGGPPNAPGESVLFDLPNTQTVIFQTDTTTGVHSVTNGNVTYQLNQTLASASSTGLIVGGTLGLTGRLTILNGTMTGDMNVGNVIGSTGFFTIGADAIFDAAASSTTVASSGVGTLTITSGGDYTGTASLIVGNAAGSNGTVAVTGDGSSLTSGALTVGSSGVGEMTISGGASASTQVLRLGGAAAGMGELSVSGAGSTLTTNNQEFDVGDFGDGELAISAGGTIHSGVALLAANAGSTGSAVVSGAGSTWNSGNLVVGGFFGANGGAGTLTIANGGAVNVIGNVEIRPTAGTSLTIDGGTLTTSGVFTKLGALNHRDGTLHVKGTFDNGASPSQLVIDGTGADDLPTLRLSNVATAADVTSVIVGNVNRGALVLDTGRDLALGANYLSIGAGAPASGAVTATGVGTTIVTTGAVAVGGSGFDLTTGGEGTLQIRDGASVTAGSMHLFARGALEIDGGTLNVGTFSANGGQVDFVRGTVNFTAANTNLQPGMLDALLGGGHVLKFGQSLSSSNSLQFAAPITVDGGALGVSGAIINDSVMTIRDGSLFSNTTLTNGATRTLVIAGTGQVVAISGIANNGTLLLDHNTIPTGNGLLTNGSLGVIRGTGVIGNPVTNDGLINPTNGDIEFLAVVTNSAGTGLISGHDGTLRFGGPGFGGLSNSGAVAFSGGAMDVYGDVTNNVGGRITVTGGGVTTFYDDFTIAPGAGNVQASAVGGVTSSVVFLGSYNGGVTGGGSAFIEGDHRPGASPGLVSFGGDLFYGGNAALSIELGGLTRGTQYDAVDVADDAVLGGDVNVSLINGFTPSLGNTFEILTAAGGRSGTFDLGSLPALGGGLDWALTYTSTSAVLSVVTPGFQSADFDEDGDVDAADLAQWQGDFGVNDFSDADDDGDSDGADFLAWQQQRGSGLPATGSAAAVPEPGSATLLIAGELSLLVRRRRSGAAAPRIKYFCGVTVALRFRE